MITAEAKSYSVTRNSSHFKEFRTSNNEEGELRPSASQTTTSADTGGSMEVVSSTGENHLRMQDASEDIGQEKGISRPMRVSRKPKRLIEEL
ncbi:hypothetical protein NDU88_005352 [Pleurodeles waltl]|uniref:Uncharacterized protein n=1 Tax=Pleurodeles waltl TaxID=8319 RepID=A0AAV7TBC0_PLEWA|nr:hypothetical protein NDU88_005352 [Pleurodeles waltl]